MDSKSDGSGFDPESVDVVLRLLWREHLEVAPGRRGPRRKLSVDEIIAAGVALADAEGLEALSMRKVAEAVGVSVMSLYSYVPHRSGLIGLMVDEVIGRTALPELPEGVGERLRMISDLLWDEYHRHPWLVAAQSHRPWIGPHTSARYEWELGALEGIGLDDIAMDHTVALVESHASASASNSINAQKLADDSGVSDVDWWNANAPFLEQVMPDEGYPVSGRVGSAVGEAYQAVTSHRAVYEFGVETIIAGVEARLSAPA
ncbi:TetR/AcrR family transcriptional regulator [Brevibacterium sediminis]|uniref:TetR family transcriptional regulator n=1 Tax=Brevibacterium sediminis TaxID=1857024 RepID=A0ABQ1N040_9MICO|nr:TetR/AcrR family transcriptional regulator [Brevibacterium sediminis]MCS4593329.1 TetR/AcrR family transcriptional regulator [Brevibacterium sediminis]GGC50040.1 TetR family transcriptional regulator [Brevibacterium sediminis]